jgi:5-methylcytosine-specific restriction protein A
LENTSSRGGRNPTWKSDELILALDLYFRHNPSHISKNHVEVKQLSDILNSLPIHEIKLDEEKFRNANGVYMKLCNFLRYDPDYTGVGLQRGGKLEQQIWDEFAHKREYLHKVAESIKNLVASTNYEQMQSIIEDEEDEFPEGKVLYRRHRMRERSQSLVRRAKQLAFEKHGRLMCECCKFDFSVRYGELGQGYIECHHTIPVSEYTENAKTRVQDLALVCSNCHRMLHRKRPWLSIGELSKLILIT